MPDTPIQYGVHISNAELPVSGGIWLAHCCQSRLPNYDADGYKLQAEVRPGYRGPADDIGRVD